MKLRRRRTEDQHCVFCRHPARPRPEPPLPLPPPPPSIPLSPPPPPPARILRRPASPPPRAGRAIFSSYPLSSCSASPFLFHKITEATERGGRGTQPAGPAVLSNDSMRAPSSPHPCPSRWPACSPPFSLSPVSKCGSSTSSEAIGKQRPKMNYPVSLPSLTNK